MTYTRSARCRCNHRLSFGYVSEVRSDFLYTQCSKILLSMTIYEGVLKFEAFTEELQDLIVPYLNFVYKKL